MRVDANRLDDAAYKMHRISEQLFLVCAQMNEINARLRFQMLDGGGVSESVFASLFRQIKDLNQRVEGSMRMSEVLYLAAEEYRTCEQISTSMAQSQNAPVVMYKVLPDLLTLDYKEIVAEQEAAVYRHYIAPLINLGKRESE